MTTALTVKQPVHLQKAVRAAPINVSFSRPANLSSTGAVGGLSPLDSISQSALTVAFSPAITLEPTKKYEAVVVSASMPYTVPNIGPASADIPGYAAGNNRISISWNNAVPSYTDYLVPSGLYAVSDLQLALNQIAVTAGWITSATNTPLFTLVPVVATQQLIVQVSPVGLSGMAFPANGVKISFANPGALSLNDSIGPVMGFPTSGSGSVLTIAGGGTAAVSFTAPNEADFAQLTGIVVQTNIVTGSYLNGSQGGALLTVNVAAAQPNTIIAYTAAFPAPVPISQSTIGTAQFWLTTQAGNIIGSLGQSWGLTFMIREVMAET